MGEVFWQRDVALINILSDLGPHAGPRKDQGGQGTQHLGQARVETTTAPHSGRLKHPGSGKQVDRKNPEAGSPSKGVCWGRCQSRKGALALADPG